MRTINDVSTVWMIRSFFWDHHAWCFVKDSGDLSFGWSEMFAIVRCGWCRNHMWLWTLGRSKRMSILNWPLWYFGWFPAPLWCSTVDWVSCWSISRGKRAWKRRQVWSILISLPVGLHFFKKGWRGSSVCWFFSPCYFVFKFAFFFGCSFFLLLSSRRDFEVASSSLC